MNIHPDFEELLRLLEEHAVEYMTAAFGIFRTTAHR
jgi:hypothetical protein